MILDDDQVDDLINISILIIIIGGAISFYLHNPIWQYSILAIILTIGVFLSILYNVQKRRIYRIRIEYPLKEKIRELEQELNEVKRR